MALVKYADAVKQIKSGELHNLYYFYGRDTLMVEKLTNILLKKLVKGSSQDGLYRLDGKKLDLRELSDISESFPMFTDYNVILINDLNGEDLTADAIKQLTELISDIPEATVIIFNITGFDVKNGKKAPTAKNKKIIDIAVKKGIACEMDLYSVTELAKIIAERADRLGCKINRNNAEELAGLCLCNTMMALNELDKLCAYADGREITAEMLRLLVSKQLDTNAFALAKAITAFNGWSAMELLDELISQREEPVAVLAVISLAFIDLYRARAAMSCAKRDADVINDFGYKGREFAVRNAFRDCTRTSLEHLRECIRILKRTDAELKSTRTDSRILIEKAIAEMLVAGKSR